MDNKIRIKKKYDDIYQQYLKIENDDNEVNRLFDIINKDFDNISYNSFRSQI